MKNLQIEASNDTVLNPPEDKFSKVYKWSYIDGKDNQLPNIIQHLATQSVTAKRCIDKVTSAIIGGGFENGDIIVSRSGHSLNQVGRFLARQIATHWNAFIHARFNTEHLVGSIDVVPAIRARVGLKDQAKYSAKIAVADWSKKRLLESDVQKVDVLNLNTEIIKSQVEKAKSLSSYKGQILHINFDPSVIYSPSPMIPVLEDCEAEKLSKHFTRNTAKYGFMNGKLVLVGKMNDGERSAFMSDLAKMQGGENASNLLVYEATDQMTDLTKQAVVMDLAGNPDDKVLSYSDQKVEASICKAFGVPIAMVSSRSEGIFGNSGELLKEMNKQLFEEKDIERRTLEESLNRIIKHSVFKDKLGTVKILNPWEK